MRADASMAVQLARDAVQVLFDNSGATGIQAAIVVQRCLRDINALGVHALLHKNNNSRSTAACFERRGDAAGSSSDEPMTRLRHIVLSCATSRRRFYERVRRDGHARSARDTCSAMPDGNLVEVSNQIGA